MPIVGTAGHVDHGKSTLVEALTGRDPDRWPEEKERGLTIDLGFAWTDLDGMDVGFVDVPGHERFIKNMLAGVGEIDCALLVVAADSGWMPQTEEHAAILDLLDTAAGVIALTRIDLVDSDTVELATLEVMEEIEGTVLEGWAIVHVSPVSGEGMAELRAELAAALRGCERSSTGPLRMWVDRSFTIKGAGAVVTGTVSGGSVAPGDEVLILPGAFTDKVRGLHHHDHDVDRAVAGSRAAINLQSSKVTEVRRGSLICSPGSIGVTKRLLAVITPSRSFEEIPARGAFHVHIGTASSPAIIRRIHGSDAYRLALAGDVPAAMADRFILRDAGRQTVVGGGRVLDPEPTDQISRDQLHILIKAIDLSPREMADALLAVRGITDSAALLLATGGVAPSSAIHAGALILSEDAAGSIAAQSHEITAAYHEAHPLREGIPKPELATQIGVDTAVLEAAIRSSAVLEESHGAIHLSSFDSEMTVDQESNWSRVRAEMENSFDVPRMSAVDLTTDEIHALIRREELKQVAPDLVFTDTQIREILNRLGELPDGFTVSQFKELFGMSRRQAVPTLEWLDKTGQTRRSGDQRSVRSRP